MGVYHCTYHAKCKKFKWPKPLSQQHDISKRFTELTYKAIPYPLPGYSYLLSTSWEFFFLEEKDKTINNCLIMEKTCRCTDLHWTHSCWEQKRTAFGTVTKQLLWMIESWRKKRNINSIISINIVAVVTWMRLVDYFLKN